jgi:hypothetical protein
LFCVIIDQPNTILIWSKRRLFSTARRLIIISMLFAKLMLLRPSKFSLRPAANMKYLFSSLIMLATGKFGGSEVCENRNPRVLV